MAALDDTIRKLEQLIKLLNQGKVDTKDLDTILGSLKSQQGLEDSARSARKLLDSLNGINVALSTLNRSKAPSWLPGLMSIQRRGLQSSMEETWQGFGRMTNINLLGGSPAPSAIEAMKQLRAATQASSPANIDILQGKLGLTPQQIEKLKIETEALNIAWETAKLKVKALDDGLIRLSISTEKSGWNASKLTRFISQTGEVLDKIPPKAQKVVQSIEELRTGLGPGRADKAMALATKSGFGIKDLSSVYTQQPSGISFLRFEKEVDGVLQKGEVTVNKYGETIMRTNKRLLGFTEAIIRNTAEVLRWSIGVGLVYGTMRKFQDLLAVAIDNQTKLADVTVVLGDAQRDVNDIFDDANEIAQQTGETINGVIESYTMAYRAVGAIEEPTRRTAAANQLLYDSTVLNKLSNLSAAESIDVLSGSLRQLQGPEEDVATAFDRGTELLDKWVKVTTRANVDLSTLATAFSITSESAENAGMTIEELNATIAVLSEKIGGLGGRETGNAVRALIGGVYQQQAAEILDRYGIATKDNTDKMRDFLDISREIYDLYSQGIISEDELNKVAYVLGGGVRRGQQYVAFLSDLGRVQEIVATQADSQGSAEEALGRKLETVSTATTKLNNAFQSLAQTLGTDGGILDTFTGLVNAATSLVSALEKISDWAGGFIVPAGLIALLTYFTKARSGQYQDFQSNIGGRIGGWLTAGMNIVPSWRDKQVQQPVNALNWGGGTQLEAGAASTYGSRFGVAAGKYGLGMMMGVVPGIAQMGKIGGTAGLVEGGAIIAGGIIGTLATAGSPIGGVIGTAIASSFVNGVEDSEGTLEDLFRRVQGKARETQPGGPGSPQKTPEEIIEEMMFAPDIGSKYGAKITAYIQNLTGGAGAALSRDTYENVTAYSVQLENIQMSYDILNEKRSKGIQLTEKEAQLLERYKTILDLVAKSAEELPAEAFAPGQEPTTLLQQEVYKRAGGFIQGIQEKERYDLQNKLVTGQVTGREFTTGIGNIAALDAQITKLYSTMYTQEDLAATSTEVLYQRLSDLADLILKASPEEINQINQINESIKLLQNGLQSIEGDVDGIFKIGEASYDATSGVKELNRLMQLNNDLMANIDTSYLLRNFKQPQVVEMDTGMAGYLDKIMRKAYSLQTEYLKKATIDGSTLSDQDVKTIVDSFEPVWVKIGDQWQQVFKIDPKYIEEARKDLEEAGDIPEMGGIGFQAYDMTQGAFAQAMSGYASLLATLTGMGYQADEQDQIGIFQDGIKPLHYDFKIVQYLLSQILDTEKKQLEGMWNLPEGASFWIPLQTAQLYSQSGGGPALPAGGTEEEKQTTIEDLAAAERERMLVLGEGLQAQGPFNMQAFLEALNSFANKLSVTTPTGQTTQGLDQASRFQFGYHLRPGEAAPPEDTTKLAKENIINFKLEIQSRTQLVVDGRTLADIIKPYLESDMLAAEGQRTITRSVVI